MAYTLQQGPNGEALVYDGSTVMPLPGANGLPMPFNQAQAQWQDLLPQLPQLLQQAAATGMQPGVSPVGPAATPSPGTTQTYISPADYNAGYAAPGGTPSGGIPNPGGSNAAGRTSADGRYTVLPNGNILDNTGNAVWSPNMAPQNVLDAVYGPGSRTSTRPSDAATLPGETAPAAVNGVVKTNVVGNPTAGERANGITTTGYPLPATPGTGPVAPAAPVSPLNFRRIQLPTNIDPTASASSLFGQYVGTYNQGLPPPRPTTLPNVAQGPGVGGNTAAPGVAAASQGTQFRPLSIAPAPAAAPATAAVAPTSTTLSAPPPAATTSSPTINVNGQQVASLQPSAIVGSAAYNAQQAANKAALDASNRQGEALAATRVYGQGNVGEEGGGGTGWYLPSQLTANQPQNNAQMAAPPPAIPAAFAGAYRAATGTAAPGAPVAVANPADQVTLPSGPVSTGTRYAALSGPIPGVPAVDENGNLVPDPNAPAPAPAPGTQGTQGTGGTPAAGSGPGQANEPQPTATPPVGYVWQHTQKVGQFGQTVWTWDQVPARQDPSAAPYNAQPAKPADIPGYDTVPQYNSAGQIAGWSYQPQRPAQPSGTVTADQAKATLDQTLLGLNLTQAQIDQLKAMLPINIAQGNANVAQTYAAIQNAATQMGLNIDQQRFNQAYQTAQQNLQAGEAVGQVNINGTDLATLGRVQTMGYDQYGNPTLAAQNQQVQNALGYAASNRADIGVQQANTQIMGYDANGNPTLAGQTAMSTEDRANLLAQAQIGDQAANIRLQELAQQEGQRQFDINNEQAWRQNPSSIFDRVYNNRAGLSAAATVTPASPAAAPGAPLALAAPPASTGTQYAALSAPPQAAVTTSNPNAAPPSSSPGNMTLTAPADRSPLTYGEIKAAGAEPPGIAAATSGQRNMGTYQPAGGMPMVSDQAYNQLNPEERQVFDAQLRATGNDPATYAFNRQRLTAPAIRTSGGFSAPRRLMPAGAL